MISSIDWVVVFEHLLRTAPSAWSSGQRDGKAPLLALKCSLSRGERHVSNYRKVQVMMDTQGSWEHEKDLPSLPCYKAECLDVTIPGNVSINTCPRERSDQEFWVCVLGSLCKLMLCINGGAFTTSSLPFWCRHPNFPQGSSSWEPPAMTLQCRRHCNPKWCANCTRHSSGCPPPLASSQRLQWIFGENPQETPQQNSTYRPQREVLLKIDTT